MDIDWEQLEADREAGTPGPWRVRCASSTGDRCTMHYEEVWNDDTDILVTTEVTRAHNDGGYVNIRRIARVPDLEAYALEARAKLEAAEAMHEFMCHLWCEMKLPPDLEDKMDMVFSAWDAAQKGSDT